MQVKDTISGGPGQEHSAQHNIQNIFNKIWRLKPISVQIEEKLY